jgi:prefoldin subunit 5
MALFGSKKPKKTDIPVEQVTSMRSQGIDNNRIIQTLQRDGYSSSQVFEAMNQADMTPAVDGFSPDEIREDQTQFNDGSNQDYNSQMPPQQYNEQPRQSPFDNPAFNQPHQEPMNLPQYKERSTEVEELVESVIEEKWSDLVKDINKIIDWKNEAESRLTSMETDFENLKQEFDKLHQAILGKIGEYDKNIMNVGAEVRAMEKVFSKVLPVFTDNINELSKVTDKLKKN